MKANFTPKKQDKVKQNKSVVEKESPNNYDEYLRTLPPGWNIWSIRSSKKNKS